MKRPAVQALCMLSDMTECGITQPARNQTSTCETAADALSNWLDARGGAVTSTTANCLPIVWSTPELLSQSGPSANCRTWTYLFNATFAPGGSATNEAQFQSIVSRVRRVRCSDV
jgi:hypothetical protein